MAAASVGGVFHGIVSNERSADSLVHERVSCVTDGSYNDNVTVESRLSRPILLSWHRILPQSFQALFKPLWCSGHLV